MNRLAAILILALPLPAAAYDAPANPAAVRDGTSMTVTWEHSGDAKSFSVWQAQAAEAPGKIFSGSQVYPGDTARTSTFPVPRAAEVPELCGIYVVARYLPEQPNQASEQVCATEAGAAPPPAEPQPEPQPDPDPDPAFTIVEITWTPPTTRENDSPLAPADIAGYQLYWDSDNPPTENKIENVTASPVELSLPVGVWYVAMQTIDTKGNHSNLSTPAVRIQIDPPEEPLAMPRPPTLTGVQLRSGVEP